MKRYLFFVTIILASANAFTQPFKGGKGDGHAHAEQKNVFISSVRSGSQMDVRFFPSLMGVERNLSVRSSSEQLQILVYDPAGKMVLQEVIRGNQDINLVVLTAGIYFIELRSGDDRKRGKLTIIE